MREQAARELAPYRSRMQALQIRQIEQQFLRRRLLERYEPAAHQPLLYATGRVT